MVLGCWELREGHISCGVLEKEIGVVVCERGAV